MRHLTASLSPETPLHANASALLREVARVTSGHATAIAGGGSEPDTYHIQSSRSFQVRPVFGWSSSDIYLRSCDGFDILVNLLHTRFASDVCYSRTSRVMSWVAGGTTSDHAQHHAVPRGGACAEVYTCRPSIRGFRTPVCYPGPRPPWAGRRVLGRLQPGCISACVISR